MRVRTIAVFSLLLAASCWASPPTTGAFVENIRFEKQSRIAFVQIVNTSTRDISGMNLSIDVTYEHGQYHYERILDFAARMVDCRKAGLEDNGALHPNTTLEERLDLPARGGLDNRPLAVTAKIDLVAYSDSTVEVSNESALSRLIGLRKNRILADQKAAEIINEAAADPVTPDPRGMALAKLRVLLEQAKHKQGEHELETELMVIIDDLEKRGSQTSPGDLRQYANGKFRDSEAMEPHVALRRSR